MPWQKNVSKSIIVSYILLNKKKKHVKKDNTWCCYLLEKTCSHISEWHNKIKMIKWLTWIWCLSHNQILCHSWVINPTFLSMGNPILMPILAAAYLINLSIMTINNAEWILSLKLGINGTIAASCLYSWFFNIFICIPRNRQFWFRPNQTV